MTVTISFFIYAENAVMQAVPNAAQQLEPKIQVFAPNFVFRPSFVPCLFSYAVSVGLHDFDVRIQHELRMTLHDNNEGPALADTGTMPLAPFPDEMITNLPENLRGITFTCDFRNVPFRHNGIYYTRVLFDGVVIGSYPIHIWGNESFEHNSSGIVQ